MESQHSQLTDLAGRMSYRNGDKIKYTGKSQVLYGSTFYEFIYLEGSQKGVVGVTRKLPAECGESPKPDLSKGYYWDGDVAVNPETGDAARYTVASELDADTHDAEFRAIRKQHDCPCEVCSTVSVVCPASASSYAQEILQLRRLLKSTMRAFDYFQSGGSSPSFAAEMAEKIRKALRLAQGEK